MVGGGGAESLREVTHGHEELVGEGVDAGVFEELVAAVVDGGDGGVCFEGTVAAFADAFGEVFALV